MANVSAVKKPKVLVVDDEPTNLQILGRLLQNRGLDVALAADASQALRSLEFWIPNIFLLDVMMPGMDGYKLAQKLKAMPATENKPIIFLSALEDTESKIKAFDAGGADYITKPFSPKEVIARVFNQLELEEYRARMEDRVREQVLQIETITMSLVEVLEYANYYWDDDTGLHIRRVTEYSRILSDQLPLDEWHRKEIVRYTSLHDIGKVGIPDTILRKPGRLTDTEWDIMKRHPEIGFRILDKPAIPSALGRRGSTLTLTWWTFSTGEGMPSIRPLSPSRISTGGPA
jgi:putative two-component system response regulator